MPATRKIQNTVQNQDLTQLKNLFGSTDSSISVNKENIIKTEPDTFSENEHEVIAEKDSPAENLYVAVEDKKEILNTTVGIRMSTAKKREMKTYFTQHGITMSQGVIDAFSLLKKLEDDGFVVYKDGLLEITNA